MPNFVGEHVRSRELRFRTPELTFEFVKKRGIQVHRLVTRAVERTNCGRRHTAPGFDSFREEDDPRGLCSAPEESQQLRDLLFLHDKIRDAATSPTTARTAVRTAAGLLIPTIAFIITVFGEVSAERLLDAILP